MLRLFAAILLTCAASHGRAEPSPVPLTRAHAHNDYEHKRPLLDALDHGFCSVEADIHLVGDQLLVAHNRSAVKPERTLQALYLDPLRERSRQNNGHIYPNGPEVSLLIDIKGDWHKTYPVLRRVLQSYSDVLTTYERGTRHTRAVRVILSGNRSREMFDGESVRYAAFDGELTDLDSDAPADLIPWISSNWVAKFKWRGSGPFTDAEREKLQDIVRRAHGRGRLVRFWGAPDKREFWSEILKDGVDLINTDDLAGVQAFLLDQAESRGKQKP